MGFAIDDIDSGFDEIAEELTKLSESTLLIGFQEGDETQKETKGQRTKEAGLSIAQIAGQNEFGDGKIPPRPFMSTSFDENLVRINKIVASQIIRIEEGRRKSDFALDVIGLSIVDMIQAKITQIMTPPNSPTTIAIKGSSKPLIDFGQMRQSVRHVVVR
jgi:hypothetical protein